VFSFHAVKNLTTAEGGAIALNLPAPFDNEAVYKYLCIFTLHGQNKDALAKMQKGNWKYDIIEAGYKCNMTDISAAIGMVELARYDSETLLRRKHICELYTSYFSKFSWAQLPVQQKGDSVSSYHLYPLRVKGVTEQQRDEIIKRIFDQDVSVNVHFIPLPMLSFYRNLGYDISQYPATYSSFAAEISLPVFYDLTDSMVSTVCNSVSSAVESVLNEK
jgi:dTDP-4-amino-4,6-dideoxygalactose transaminase